MRDATGLLGLQITHPGTRSSGPGGIPGRTLDLAAIFFGDGFQPPERRVGVVGTITFK